MATTRTFNDMLNEYLTYDLLKEEMVKRDYVMTKIEKDPGWKGGTLPVPFKAAGASSVAFGSLTAANDIGEDKFVRGSVSGYKEAWGSLLFNQRDLMEHDGGGISEKTFLKVLPDSVDDFMDYMKQIVSVNLLNGSHFATLTANGTVGAGMEVDRPDFFVIGQKVIVDDGDSAPATGYVQSINMETKVVVLETARGSGVVVDLSAYTTAQAAKCYHDGAQSNSFTSIRESLLSAANGGSASLYGVSKLAYPYLQAINVDGSTITASNILSKLFDAYVTIRQFGKGNPAEVIVSYKHLGSILKALESSKGAFNVEPGSQKTSVYGWTEITIGGVKGALKVVGIQEAADDTIMFIDWRAMKFHSNGMFRKRVAPDGKQFFEVRNTTGFQYIVDVALYGELIVNKPSYCGILHSVSYA